MHMLRAIRPTREVMFRLRALLNETRQWSGKYTAVHMRMGDDEMFSRTRDESQANLAERPAGSVE